MTNDPLRKTKMKEKYLNKGLTGALILSTIFEHSFLKMKWWVLAYVKQLQEKHFQTTKEFRQGVKLVKKNR